MFDQSRPAACLSVWSFKSTLAVASDTVRVATCKSYSLFDTHFSELLLYFQRSGDCILALQSNQLTYDEHERPSATVRHDDRTACDGCAACFGERRSNDGEPRGCGARSAVGSDDCCSDSNRERESA